MLAQSLVPQLLSGVAGGNLAGVLFGGVSLGTLGNSIVGLIGGALGGYLLGNWADGVGAAAAAGTGVEMGSLVSNLVSGGAGGILLTAIIGVIRNMAR